MAIQKSKDFFLKLQNELPHLMSWLSEQSSSCGYPVYTSMDIRDAGWKVAVVDVNLFPAGFNNLTSKDFERAAKFMREFFSAKLLSPSPWTITVVPEANTNNQGYLENVAGIMKLLKSAGCEPKLLWPGTPAIPKPWTIKTQSGSELTYLPVDEALKNSSALLLNHDLSGGVPNAIKNVTLPTFPSTKLGWYRRRKSTHQDIVEAMLNKMERHFPWFDPWYFQAQSIVQKDVNFESDDGIDNVTEKATTLWMKIQNEYRLRDIPESPRLFIKNDAGTYGMGVFSIKDPSEILDGGRWLRSKMKKGKESVPISQVIIQEAVPTALTFEKDSSQGKLYVAGEPVLYLVNGVPIGGFMRIHEGLGAESGYLNLNQPGSKLEPFECPDTPGHTTLPFPELRGESVCTQITSRGVYGFLARLHAISAGLEECPQ